MQGGVRGGGAESTGAAAARQRGAQLTSFGSITKHSCKLTICEAARVFLDFRDDGGDGLPGQLQLVCVVVCVSEALDTLHFLPNLQQSVAQVVTTCIWLRMHHAYQHDMVRKDAIISILLRRNEDESRKSQKKWISKIAAPLARHVHDPR